MAIKRYEVSRKTELDKFETYRFPDVKKSSSDYYIFSREGDRLDLLSNEFYKDPRLWWIIAEANNLGKGGFAIKPGLQLRIPFPVDDMFTRLETAVEER